MESGTKLYSINVQGFSKEFTEERLKELLSKFGDVVECCFAGPSLKAPHHEKTRAIVKFTSKMEAATAIARLDKQPPLFLGVDWTGAQPENERCKKLDGRGDRERLSVLYGRGGVVPKRYRGRSMDSNNCRDPGHPLYVPAARPEPCANCFQEGRLRCSRCKTWYCSVVCQENHWMRHRDSCIAPPPLQNPDGSIYDAELDVSNVKIVQNNDSESSSNEVISLQKLSKMGRSGPLNSTLKEDHASLLDDKTLIEMVEKSRAVENILDPSAKLTEAPEEVSNIDVLTGVYTTELSDSAVSNVDSSSFKSRVASVSHENNNVPELATESSSNAANKSKIKATESSSNAANTSKTKAISTQIETPTKEISKKSEKVSKFIENKTEEHQYATEDSPLLVGQPILVSVSHAVSPNEFYVVPESSQKLFEAIVLEIQDQPNTAAEILPGETCLARHEGLWYRGRITQVDPDGASARVVLIDFGMIEKIPASEMKALTVYRDVGGVACRVRMAGIAPKGGSWTAQEIQTFQRIVDEGGETKFCATVIGYNGKGETLVKLVDDDKNDVGDLCVEVGVGIKVIDTFMGEKKETLENEKKEMAKTEKDVKTIESKVNVATGSSSNAANKSKIKAISTQIETPTKEISKKPEKVSEFIENKTEKCHYATEDSPLLATEDSPLLVGQPILVSVNHVVSPSEFYAVPESSQKLFEAILLEIQDQPNTAAELLPGETCLARHEELWYRGRITQVAPDGASARVVLIDFGMIEKIPVSDMKALAVYRDVGGVACRVGMAGIAPKGDGWTTQEIETFQDIVDEGGETKFCATVIGYNGKGETLVNLVDDDKNDVGDLCVEVGVGIKIIDTFVAEKKETLEIEVEDKKGMVKSEKDIKTIESKVNVKEKSDSSLKFGNPTEVRVVHCTSPRDMSILPSSKSSQWDDLVANTQAPPPGDVEPKVGKLYLTENEGVWARALVQKISPDKTQVKVDLIDFGNVGLKIKTSELRKLTKYSEVEALVERVGLVGLGLKGEKWEEPELDLFKQVVDIGGETKFVVESLGDLDGIEMVTMKDLEGTDIKEMCVTLEIGIILEEVFTPVSPEGKAKKGKPKEDVISETLPDPNPQLKLNKNKDIHETTKLQENSVSSKQTQVENVNIPEVNHKNPQIIREQEKATSSLVKSNEIGKFPRVSIGTDKPEEVSVRFAESPSKFYLMQTSQFSVFNEIIQSCQTMPAVDKVNPEPGVVCLAKIEDSWTPYCVSWHRGQVQKVSPDGGRVQLFLLDYGKTVNVCCSLKDFNNVEQSQLKSAGKFVQVPGLVCEVGLAGIKAAQGQWSQEDIENFNLVIDAGGETKFMAKAVGVGEDGVVRVEMSDLEENDITQLCLIMGVGVTCNASLKQIEIAEINVEKERKQIDIVDKLSEEKTRNPETAKMIVDTPQKKAVQTLKCFPCIELPVNVSTEVIVTHVDNPDKIYVFPSKANEKFMEILLELQDPLSGIIKPAIGLVCLAFADNLWQRAEIKKIFPEKETVQIYLVDDGKTIEVSVDVLRHLNKFTDMPGQVAEVGLINLGCGEGMWSREALDNMVTILDVGGDTTFTVTNLGKDEDGVDRVKMIDTDGNDVSHFCVEMKVGITVKHKLKSSELKEIVSKSKSPRTKPKAPIKPAAPLKTVLSTTAIPQITTSPEKNETALNSIPKASTEGTSSPFRRPPCFESVLTTLILGSKFKVMKETTLSVRYFSSICLTQDDSTTNYLLDDLQSEAAVRRLSGAGSASFDVRSWVVAWSLSDQMYYRAVIVGVTPPDTYTAFLIDFPMTQQFKKADLLEMWPDAARHRAMAIQLTAVGRISPEVENLCNAHFDTNATVDCVVTEVKDNEITVLIPEMGVKFTALPWYHCDNAVKTLFQTEAPAAKAAEDKQLEADRRVMMNHVSRAQQISEKEYPRKVIMKDLKASSLAEGAIEYPTQVTMKAPSLAEGVSEYPSQVMMKDLNTSILVDGAIVKYCGHGDKLCDVYVRQEMDEEKVSSLNTTLNLAMCSRDSREFREPMIGSIVAVKWTQDEGKMFYRASVTAISPEKKKAKLLLVDCGKRIVEDWVNITWLPHEVRRSPMYSVPVVLADVLPSPTRQHTRKIEDVAREFESKPLKLTYVHSNNVSPPTVKLGTGTNSLNAALRIVGHEDDGVSEKEKRRLEIAQEIARLKLEMSKV